MEPQPTNKELLERIEEQNKQFADHAQEDIAQFGEVRDESRREFDAVHARLDGVATKVDIQDLSKKIEPVLDAYKAIIFSKSFVGGLAALIIGISAIGVGVSWFINSLVQR